MCSNICDMCLLSVSGALPNVSAVYTVRAFEYATLSMTNGSPGPEALSTSEGINRAAFPYMRVCGGGDCGRSESYGVPSIH